MKIFRQLAASCLIVLALGGFWHGHQTGQTTQFAVGVNFSGMENGYPVATSATEINYYAAHGFHDIRLPIGWSGVNPTYGLVGIQQAINGPLDITSTYMPFIATVNFLENSELLNSAPWTTYNASGTLTLTNNAGTGPNGTSAATLIQATRPDTSSYFVIDQLFTPTASGNYTGCISVEASDTGTVGKGAAINFYTNSGFAQVNFTFTNTWQSVCTTSNLTGATYFEILPFGGSSVSGSENFYVAQAQVNPGSTGQTYQPTLAGYLTALDNLVSTIAQAGSAAILDIHTFGTGPGGYQIGSTQVPCSAFADLWQKISVHYKGNPGVRGYDLVNEPVNGFNSTTWQTCAQDAITAIRGNGDSTTIYVEGVNYSGVWNWVTGTGQPFNNSNLYTINDPLNNLIFSGHGYLNNNSSGGDFAWNLEVAKPGQAPTGTSTSATIGPTREAPFVAWAQSHGLRMHHGETGGSTDGVGYGGNDNYAQWNTALSNQIGVAQTNQFEIDIWGAGAGFGPYYAAYPGPSNISNPNVADFSSAGLQSPVMAMLEQYTGYGGAQPTAYRIDLPTTAVPPTAISPPTITGTVSTYSELPTCSTVGQYYQTFDTTYLWYCSAGGWLNAETPNITTTHYGTSGVASGNFSVRYNGVIPSGGCTITPAAYLSDGVTSAGGTFIPSTIPLAAGINAIAHFTYTASQSATIEIVATNNCGWTNPPALGYSTIDDVYAANTIATPSDIFGMYRRYTPYIGPAITLQRSSDNTQETFYWNNIGNLPRAAIQTWAGSNIIPVVTIYDQSPNGNNIVCATNLPVLNLNNAASYPDIETNGHNITCNFNVPVNGQTQLSTIARIDPSNGLSLFRMDWYTGPFVSSFGSTAGFEFYNSGYVNGGFAGGGGEVAGTILGTVLNAYHEYAVTYQSLVTNGFQSFKDGTQIQEQTVAGPTSVAQFIASQTGNILTVTNIGPNASFGGAISVGNVITGTSVPSGEAIVSCGSCTGTGGLGTYQTSLSGTVASETMNATAPGYIINAAYDNVQVNLGYFKFGSQNFAGAFTNLEFEAGQTLTGAQVNAIDSADATYYSTPLPDVLPPLNPAITGASNQSTVSGVASHPFSAVVVTDPNTPSPTDSVTITLTGYAATLSGSGLSGSYPTYTLAAAAPASITSELQALSFTSTGSAGNVTDVNILVTSSFTTTASANPTVTIISTGTAPVISGLVAPNVSMDQGAPALWQATVTDTSPAATENAVVTVSGASGTMSNLGPYAPTVSGSTYSFTGLTPANLTRALRNLLWLPSTTTVGTTTSFALQVTNNYSLSATASNVITNVAAAAMPSTLTPTASPGALPSNYRGMNFSGGENWPAANYQNSSVLWSWAESNNFGTIRLPFLFSSMERTALSDFAFPATITGSISSAGGNLGVLTVTATGAPLFVGQSIFYPGSNPSSQIGVILSLGTGTGGVGTYNIDNYYNATISIQALQLAIPLSQLYANFNSADVAAMQAGVEFGRANGQYVILDDHSYGGMLNPFPVGTVDEVNLAYGGAFSFLNYSQDIRMPNSAFADNWQRMETYFKNYANVIDGLQNEAAWSGAEYLAASIAASTAIRTVSNTVLIQLPSVSNVSGFPYTNFAGYTDPGGGPFMFDVHQYFPVGSNTCTGTASGYFGTYINWLNTNGYQSTVTEFAWGSDSSCTVTLGPAVMSLFAANPSIAGWNWWGGGDFPTSYVYYMGPAISPPQLPQLSPYLP